MHLPNSSPAFTREATAKDCPDPIHCNFQQQQSMNAILLTVLYLPRASIHYSSPRAQATTRLINPKTLKCLRNYHSTNKLTPNGSTTVVNTLNSDLLMFRQHASRFHRTCNHSILQSYKACLVSSCMVTRVIDACTVSAALKSKSEYSNAHRFMIHIQKEKKKKKTNIRMSSLHAIYSTSHPGPVRKLATLCV
ncbi:hypothetical protein DM02DRAFT_289088 [Periconia macrospinosa]|uniref:Uncharacterized protein n=1 Tax=Periconia macrospinosa TaxID=97972 RepID=A0A2V1EB38_9PLEO|nr:hypothetical protein DM02DRAFT_289088 [Periconia macrospinosa]